MRSLLLTAFTGLTLITFAACAPKAPKAGDTVWAQWKPNQWYHGKVEKKTDIGFHVKFDDGDEANLSAGLIASDAAPTKVDLKPGTRILVPQNDTIHQAATVTKVDGDKVSLIYEDLSEGTVEVKDARLLPVNIPAGRAAKVDDVVWAQWRPNGWFRGKVAKKTDWGFHVEFDDGDKADLAAAVIVRDKAPAKDDVKVGGRVLATWTDGKFYPGTVTKIADGKYAIKFDDGDEGDAPLDELRLLNE